MKKEHWAVLLVFLILFVDQLTKILVKTSMHAEEMIPVLGDRVFIYFVENPGFAFGMKFGGVFGKIALTLFRIVASFFIALYIRKLIKRDAPLDVVIGLSAILAGAMGNIIDSAFYGVLFGESSFGTVAEFLPESGGYAPFLQGHVVDMIYCPILRGTFPDWLPIFGGDSFTFFRPIFNIADSAITVGVIYLLLFQRKFFKEI
ncbi:MAG: lipoprotein signal peptidase [Bacteroidetes bacterium ADurb.Bin217]|nr:MAG: lipoprotein signal peptidase [Bacteroidetes bacterium ADurb.Bin217]